MVLEIFHDITRELELEKFRDDLTNMIVHDLKNPLTGIASAIELLVSGLICPVTEEQKKYFDLVQGSVRAMTNLIMNLLDVKKMEDNKLELQRSAFSAEKVISNIAWMKSMADKDNKPFLTEVESGIGINADENLITRILENLLSNAIKHTRKGDSVRLKISRTVDRVLFEVIDSGEGIPPEYLGRVFDKFFKVESQTLKTRIDTGLGLTFCKMAVEAHGGKIGVESEVDKGSRFYFYLPAG